MSETGSLFWCFFCVCALPAYLCGLLCFFFFFWGGKRWEELGSHLFFAPLLLSLAVGWNNIYRLFPLPKMLWGWLLAEEDLSQSNEDISLNGALPKHFQPGPKLNSLWIMFLGKNFSSFCPLHLFLECCLSHLLWVQGCCFLRLCGAGGEREKEQDIYVPHNVFLLRFRQFSRISTLGDVG